MDLVDTHCHIQSIDAAATGDTHTRELWAKNPDLTGDSVVKAAAKVGVSKLICVGCDLPDSQLAVEFVQARPGTWASIGIHPHESQHYANSPEKLAEFAELAKKPKVVAIGECGFDFFYNHSPKADQTAVLKFQLELAQAHNVPVIFHVREAFDDFWPLLEQYPGIRGVLHSFTDSAANLAIALQKGLYIGVNGIATFAKDPAQLAVYKSIPLERLLLETDAPFLTPTPYRGSINEPKQVGTIADFLSALREELYASTTAKAVNLFGLK